MDYLSTLRNIRRLLFTAFVMTIAFVTLFWLFVMTNAMQFFLWALPGFTLETANLYILWLVGPMEVAGIILFLIPSIVLSLEIACAKKRLASDGKK